MEQMSDIQTCSVIFRGWDIIALAKAHEPLNGEETSFDQNDNL